MLCQKGTVYGKHPILPAGSNICINHIFGGIAPPEIGSWSYKLYVHAIFGTDSSVSNSFTVTNDTLKGYIGTDTLTPSRYFKYKAIGQVLMPLGFNSISVGSVNEYTMYNRVIIQVVYQPFKIFRAQFRGVID